MWGAIHKDDRGPAPDANFRCPQWIFAFRVNIPSTKRAGPRVPNIQYPIGQVAGGTCWGREHLTSDNTRASCDSFRSQLRSQFRRRFRNPGKQVNRKNVESRVYPTAGSTPGRARRSGTLLGTSQEPAAQRERSTPHRRFSGRRWGSAGLRPRHAELEADRFLRRHGL